MASDVEGIERITEHPVTVPPSAVEQEFNRIWRETVSAGMDESSIRLRVLNFVGIGAGDRALERFESVMAALPEQHPCRGILAMTSVEAAAVEASISAHCWRMGNGSRHLCSEEVVLRAAPGQERALASAVLALLVPEVPVTVWVIGDPDLECTLVSEIAESADRVFMDSLRSRDVAKTFREALHLDGDHDLEVCDLAWSRLACWRALVAQFFDRDDALAELARLQSIEIVSGGERASSEAMLLAGWLVSRLGLSLVDVAEQAGNIDATLYDATRGVRLGVKASGPSVAAVHEVRIRTQSATFLVQVHDESGHMHVREEWPDGESRRTVGQPPADDPAVFAGALDGGDEPSVYTDALRAASSLMGEQGASEATGSRAEPS